MESKGINLTFSRLMKYKWVVVIGTLLSAALSVYIAMQQPNKYTAKVYLVPSNAKEGGGLNKLAGQFGGLASMAGISLGGSEADEIETAIEFMGSRGFIQPFIEKRNLLPGLLALKGWDKILIPIFIILKFTMLSKKWVRTPPLVKMLSLRRGMVIFLIRQLRYTLYEKKGRRSARGDSAFTKCQLYYQLVN